MCIAQIIFNIINTISKNVDSSNSQTVSVNWTASTSNEGFILINCTQLLASSNLGLGYRQEFLAIQTSNSSIAYSSVQNAIGNSVIFSTLYTSLSASNSTSVTIQSYPSNLITTGGVSSTFTVEIIDYTSVSELGNISLS